jgi:hypothetical protein
MNNLLERLMPFLMIGIMLVLFVAGIILFSYFLILGAIVGGVLFLVAWFRERFFSTKQIKKVKRPPTPGITIDHDEIK